MFLAEKAVKRMYNNYTNITKCLKYRKVLYKSKIPVNLKFGEVKNMACQIN